MTSVLEQSYLPWTFFLLFIAGMLAIDLGVFNRRSHAIGFREALVWSGVWIGVALIFNVIVWQWKGSGPALEFLAGYLVEKALSVDNIFVFLVLFSYFNVDTRYQHKVLFYGILGAILMRGFFILLGVELVARFHWILHLFGIFLIFTGGKLLLQKGDQQIDPSRRLVFRFFRRVVPSVETYRQGAFFIREGGRFLATPLFFVLVAVETTDLIFAVDSIPAIFAITRDPFIIFSSNILAILGLRALYFVLASAMKELEYLKVGLSLVLIYIGGKMLLADWYRIPIGASLGIIVLLIGGSVLLSLPKSLRRESPSTHPRQSPPAPPPPAANP